jgi:hypothetical protein
MMINDYLEMAAKSISHFASDGKLDAAELGDLLNIALHDGVVDANERRILTSIINKVDPSEVDAAILAKFEEVKKAVGI